MPALSESLATLWRRCHRFPGGTWLFSRLFGLAVPYSGSVKAVIRELGPGHCRVTLRDRRRIRNHLDSIHAVALVNAGELTSGLAMTMALPPDIRGIVLEIGAKYLRKARGTVVAEARVTVPPVGAEPVDLRVETAITDAAGETVCRVFTLWRLARR